MTPDPPEETTETASPSSRAGDSTRLDRIERRVLDRRGFLKGVLAGGATVGAAGAGIAYFSEGATFQSLATLAGGETATPEATRYALPAVDGTGQGKIISVTVEFTDESGMFVDLQGMEVRHDVQVALREAVATAREVTREEIPKPGVLVSFTAPDDELLALRGKSWEAGLVVALTAAFAGVDPSRRTLVTGVVAPDSALLPVGGIEAKAHAAREFGADRLLVPAGQARSVRGITVEGVGRVDAVLEAVLNR